MGTRPEELAARLAAGGPGVVVGEGLEGEQGRVLALREIKNQIIGNRTKKLLYLRLGAVPAVVAALAEPGASPAALVQAAAAAGSFACGVDDGARAVLAAGAVGHLTRLLAHPDDKVRSAPFTGLLLASVIPCMAARFGGSETVLRRKKIYFVVDLWLNWENICCVENSWWKETRRRQASNCLLLVIFA
jgi:hypothetical protein